eukprot:1839601-Pyramimonas_sp.AAC.1
MQLPRARADSRSQAFSLPGLLKTIVAQRPSGGSEDQRKPVGDTVSSPSRTALVATVGRSAKIGRR